MARRYLPLGSLDPVLNVQTAHLHGNQEDNQAHKDATREKSFSTFPGCIVIGHSDIVSDSHAARKPVFAVPKGVAALGAVCVVLEPLVDAWRVVGSPALKVYPRAVTIGNLL